MPSAFTLLPRDLITPPDQGLSYAAAGVDIDAYDRVLKKVKALVERTHGPEVASGIGPFAGLYALPGGRGHLAASADGVGTKIKVAIAARSHAGIGRDLVNHCVNDIAVMGARPLFLLDYFACGRLDDAVLLEVAEGMSAACLEAGCALLGGETAEMPGMYALGDYDLAGFIVGLVDEGRLPKVHSVRPGDMLIGLASSGLHTNGFSLVRQVFQDLDLQQVVPQLERSLADELLTPHRSYLHELERLRPRWKSAAHVTGGGLIGNLPRALPEGTAAEVDLRSWRVPEVFRLIQQRGHVDEEEMLGTFNMGIGMVLVASPDDAETIAGPETFLIGEVVAQRGADRVVFRRS